MKRLIVFAVATLIAVGGFAQGKRQTQTADERAEKVTNKMKEKLNLTDDQVQKIKAINLEAAQQKDTLKTAAKDKRAEMKEQVKTIETNRDAKIKEVLTDEQKVQYEKMKEKGKEKIDKKRAKHKGNQAPATNDTESGD